MALGRCQEAGEALERLGRYQLPREGEIARESKLLLLDLWRGYPAAGRRAERIGEIALGSPGPFGAAALAEFALSRRQPLAARVVFEAGLAELDGRPDLKVAELGRFLAVGVHASADAALSLEIDAPGAAANVDTSRAVALGCLARMRALHAEVAANRPYYLPVANTFLLMCEAEFARLERRPDPDRWAAAAESWAAQNVPFEQAYALMREGEAALQQRRNRSRAARALQAGHAIAARLGARPMAESIAALAARANIALTDAPADPVSPAKAEALETVAPVRPRGRGRHDLTPREHEVLSLLAAGYSDGEIADRLFISKKTASVHVAAIKGKLGSRSRVEIATDAIAFGLSPVPVAARDR